eukprot:8338-Heterococcus_DN1.PRE.4
MHSCTCSPTQRALQPYAHQHCSELKLQYTIAAATTQQTHLHYYQDTQYDSPTSGKLSDSGTHRCVKQNCTAAYRRSREKYGVVLLADSDPPQ